MGICLVIGLFIRIQAAIAFMMGLATIIVPGLIVMQDVPHFAYAFAFAGGALVLFLKDSDTFSLDFLIGTQKSNHVQSNAVYTAHMGARSK